MSAVSAPAAARWYTDQVAAWLREFDVRPCLRCSGGFAHGRGEAQAIERVVHLTANGRTRVGLLRWAHEIGHVVLGHRRRGVACVEEWEATVWGIRLLERDGFDVPDDLLTKWRAYVGRKALGRVRVGRPVPAALLEWCGIAAVPQ